MVAVFSSLRYCRAALLHARGQVTTSPAITPGTWHRGAWVQVRQSYEKGGRQQVERLEAGAGAGLSGCFFLRQHLPIAGSLKQGENAGACSWSAQPQPLNLFSGHVEPP